MIVLNSLRNKKVIEILKNGGIGVIPTDTLYGIVGSALNKKTVEKIYLLRRRNSKKPFIVLISSLGDLKKFGIILNLQIKKLLKKYWPGRISIVLSCPLKKFFYIHRGTKSIAFRMPKSKPLLYLLKKTGPLVAPSANFEGEKPALNIKEAQKYFANKVDFYVKGKNAKNIPSTLIKVDKEGEIKVLRFGAVKV